MKIVIAGAGAVGFHLAELLARENQDITLIDPEREILSAIRADLDVMTIQGDAASIELLKEAGVSKCQLFLAVTSSEKTNLLVAMLAKQLGARTTIARVNNGEYIREKQKENFREMGIDVLISPNQLAAFEIERLLKRATFTDVFDFEDGKLSVVGFTVDTSSPIVNKSIKEVDELTPEFSFRCLALLRDGKTIIPSGASYLRKGDHIYMALKSEYLEQANTFAGKQLKAIKNIMIVGSTPLTLKTALLLEKKYNLTVVMNDKVAEEKSVAVLQKALVIHADPGNITALKEEGLAQMDAFIALTPNAETNIIASLMAEEIGVYKTISLVDNINYTHISQNIGIDTIINKKLIAANNIFRYVRKGKVEAVASLHGVDAEMIEFTIHKRNRLLKNPLRKLHFPEKSIVAGVIRGRDSLIPEGDFVFQIDDKVIVLAMPEAINKVEEIFR